jgi:hypothetical protein
VKEFLSCGVSHAATPADMHNVGNQLNLILSLKHGIKVSPYESGHLLKAEWI